jgi:hypothetical protein
VGCRRHRGVRAAGIKRIFPCIGLFRSVRGSKALPKRKMYAMRAIRGRSRLLSEEGRVKK